MSCPMPSTTPSTLPTLATLLEELAALHPAEATFYRQQLAELEEGCARAHTQLLQDEAALAAVEPDPSEESFEAWKRLHAVVAESRRAWSYLGVSERVLREGVEFALFLVRRTAAGGPHPF